MGASKRIEISDAERDFGAVLDSAESGVNVVIERRGIPFTLQRVWPKPTQPVARPIEATAQAVGGNGVIAGSDSASTFAVPANLGGQPGVKGLRFQLRLRNRQQ